MIYTNAQIPLVAEPIHRDRNGIDSYRDHFCCAKAGVSRRKSVMPLRLLSNHQGLSVLLIPNKFAIFVGNKSFQTVPKQKDAMNTQSRRHDIYPHRYIDVPRFLTNLSHEKMNIVKLFMWLNEFSSVRHINIARACLEGICHAYKKCINKLPRESFSTARREK